MAPGKYLEALIFVATPLPKWAHGVIIWLTLNDIWSTVDQSLSEGHSSNVLDLIIYSTFVYCHHSFKNASGDVQVLLHVPETDFWHWKQLKWLCMPRPFQYNVVGCCEDIEVVAENLFVDDAASSYPSTCILFFADMLCVKPAPHWIWKSLIHL